MFITLLSVNQMSKCYYHGEGVVKRIVPVSPEHDVSCLDSIVGLS